MNFDNENHFTEQYAQTGSGFFDNIYSRALNLIPSSDDTGTKSYPGERHAPLKLKNGRMGIANFVGPGTQILKRIRRGDSGRTPVDEVAKMHDIQYSLAQTSKNKTEQIQKVRKADIRMLNSLDKITRAKSDAPINVKVGRLISVKNKLEDVGIMSKGSFGGPLLNINEADLDTLKDAQQELEQDGYGHFPASDLKNKLIEKYGKKQAKTSKKKQKGGSVDIVASVLPFLAKSLGIDSITSGSIKKLLDPLVKGTNVVKNVKTISKALLPILVSHKLKAHDVAPTAKVVKKLLKGNKQDLLKDLTVVITKIIKQQSGKGKFKGGSFWADFSKGFMMVMKPALPVLATIITPVAPEIGIPLGIVGAIINN
tara:strand:+ start:927 stop:2033 length:1107 start_codon:yes stop_codon:yes gene_type:complete